MNTEVIDAPAVAAQMAQTGALMQQQPGQLTGAGNRYIAQAPSTTPADLLRMALNQNADLDRLERLMALQQQWEANEARKAFVSAMTRFKAEPLEIFKRKQVGYTTKEGDFVGYKHAELSDVTDVVVPAMARHGLSHRWDVKQENGRVRVKCVITHEMGHSEFVEMDAAPDASGKKNAIQQVASAISYLQRYSLLAIVGLATKGMDDDGAGSGDAGDDGGADDLLSQMLAEGAKTTTDAAAFEFWKKERARFANNPQAAEKFKAGMAHHRKTLKEGAPQ